MVQTLRLRRANAAFVPLIHPVLLILLADEFTHLLHFLLCRDVLVALRLLCIPRKLQQVGRLADAVLVSVEVRHDAHDGVRHPAYCTPCGAVAVGIAHDEPARLPELYLIEKLPAWESGFAHDDLIGIAGRYAFFGFSPSSLSASSSGMAYHSFRSSTMALMALMSSTGLASRIRSLSFIGISMSSKV